MYQKRNSNNLVIAHSLVFLAALYVPAPVQSQHPYQLISAIVDRENPADGQDVFTLDTYTMIEFAYVDDGISQVRAIRGDKTQKIVRFRTFDYHTMIGDVVIFDTGTRDGIPKRIVKCQFENIDDAKEYFGFERPVGRHFEMMMFEVIWMEQYDFLRADCTKEENYHYVSAEGKIHVEKLTKGTNSRPGLRRFIIGEESVPNVVFTSKTFNITPLGNGAFLMVTIKIADFSYKVLIQFKDTETGLAFIDFVDTNDDLDRDIPINIPFLWGHLFRFPTGY